MSTSYGPSARRAYPVRISLRLPGLVHAGVEAVLGAHPDRVTLLADTSTERAHVEVFDPVVHAVAARRAHRMGIPLVALVLDPTRESGAVARRLGAARVLPLSIGADGLIRTLELVHRHGPVPRETSCVDDGGEVLSARESEVLSAICRGRSNVEIAQELYLSINSIKTYVRSAYRKIGVTRRAQAVVWGLDHGY